MIIEIDGKKHDDQKEKDKMRDDYLKTRFNLNILRYTNQFVLENDFKIILQKLEEDLISLKINF